MDLWVGVLLFLNIFYVFFGIGRFVGASFFFLALGGALRGGRWRCRFSLPAGPGPYPDY